MTTSKKLILWGCGIAAAVVVAGIAAVVFFIVYAAQDAKGVGIAVTGPPDVQVGDTFKLTVAVTNERPDKNFALSDIDIAEKYLAGFTISTIDPHPKSNMHVPIDNSRSYTFDTPIPPGQSRIFTFTLRAEKAGLYHGDVDICEGLRFVTDQAQTSVTEKK